MISWDARFVVSLFSKVVQTKLKKKTVGAFWLSSFRHRWFQQWIVVQQLETAEVVALESLHMGAVQDCGR